MFVLAISGWKRSGKDMIAEYLVENHGFKRVSFADPLKVMAAEEYNIPLDHMYNDEFKEKAIQKYPVESTDPFLKNIHDHMVGEFRTLTNEIPTKLMTSLGKTKGLVYDKHGFDVWAPVHWTPRAIAIFKGSGNRAINKEYWTHRLIKEIKESGHDKIVISDLRFKTEIKELLSQFGDDISFIRVNRWSDVSSSDSSERDLDSYEFDEFINNKDVTKEEVFRQVNHFISVMEHMRKENDR